MVDKSFRIEFDDLDSENAFGTELKSRHEIVFAKIHGFCLYPECSQVMGNSREVKKFGQLSQGSCFSSASKA